jgi:hypothetical protein
VIKGLKDILILILAAMTLIVSLIFLPWSELGFNGNFPGWLSSIMQHLGVAGFVEAKFNGLAQHPQLMEAIRSDHAPDNLNDYAYALFLFLAMTAAAIAIVLIGKEDNSEKTVLQAKK